MQVAKTLWNDVAPSTQAQKLYLQKILKHELLLNCLYLLKLPPLKRFRLWASPSMALFTPSHKMISNMAMEKSPFTVEKIMAILIATEW